MTTRIEMIVLLLPIITMPLLLALIWHVDSREIAVSVSEAALLFFLSASLVSGLFYFLFK